MQSKFVLKMDTNKKINYKSINNNFVQGLRRNTDQVMQHTQHCRVEVVCLVCHLESSQVMQGYQMLLVGQYHAFLH